MYRQSAGVANIRIAVMAGLLIFAATHAVAAIERISLGMSGMQPDDHCFSPAVSANGRFVGFVSGASNLVPGDTNNRWDVFVHDRQTGETTRVSLGPGGVELNGDSESPSLSADGRYVAFQSRADNAVPNDTNAVSDIFLYDRQTGQTTRVSRAGDGGEPNEESIRPSLTPDGRRVVFVSGASNLVAALDDDNQYDVFVRDLPTATNMLVTVSSSGENVFGFNGSISDDGRFVAFVGDVPALGPITGEGGAVFLRDLEAGTTVGVSYSNSGALIAAEGGFMLSGDGAFIAFDVRNQPVIDEDTNRHVYVRDLVSSITSRVSISTLGSPANRPSTRATRPTISRDGRFVAFTSDASNLVEGDDNERHDVFLRDRQNSTTVRISETAGGTEGDNHSSDAKISSNGELLVFSSEATNLVAGDTNGTFDIFAVEISPSNTPIGTDVVVTEGAVTVTFPAITSEGETEIVSIDPSTAGTLPGGYTLDDLSTAVQITTTAAYIPPIQVCFVANTTDPVVFDSLRILHNEGGVLVDRTVSRDFNSKKVCAAVNSLSPFVLVRFTEPPNQSPVAICRDLELQAGLVCDAATPAADELDGGSFDPEGGALTLSIGTSGPLGLGSHIITLTATDPRGASSNCQATITVVDQTPPSINVPSDVVLNATSPAGAVVNYSVSAADNCMASFTCSPASGSTFAIGTTQVNCTASDAAPNVTNGNFSVHVKGAAEQLADLIEFVTTHFGAQFPPATKHQLLAFLREPSNNPNNVDHTCQSLNLFIVVVRSRAGTPGLPASDASQLITDAQRIRAVLNCR